MAKSTLTDLKARLRAIKTNVENSFDSVSVEMANSGKALAERAVVKEGLPGEKYSTVDVPAFFLFNKTLNQRGKAFLKKKVKEGTNWGELRQAQGLPSDKVDLFYSGDMWRNIGVIRTEVRGGAHVSILGGKTKPSQDKMDWNRDRYGQFILDNINDADKEFIKQVAEDKIVEILKNTL